METEVATAGSHGSLTAVGATKAFVLAHPIGFAIAGGALLGIGAYYAAGKLLKKKDAIGTEQVAT